MTRDLKRLIRYEKTHHSLLGGRSEVVTMSWRWTEEHELFGQVRIRMVAMRRPKRRTARGHATDTFGDVESIDAVARGRVGTAVKYRRVIAELLAIAAAQHPGRFRPPLAPRDPVGDLRARLESDPPECS